MLGGLTGHAGEEMRGYLDNVNLYNQNLSNNDIAKIQ